MNLAVPVVVVLAVVTMRVLRRLAPACALGRLLDAAAAPPEQPTDLPAGLARARTLVAARAGTAFGTHFWLRPLLQDAVADRGAAHVPEPLWDLVRPDRPAPDDRRAPGLDWPTLHLVADQAERL